MPNNRHRTIAKARQDRLKKLFPKRNICGHFEVDGIANFLTGVSETEQTGLTLEKLEKAFNQLQRHSNEPITLAPIPFPLHHDYDNRHFVTITGLADTK